MSEVLENVSVQVIDEEKQFQKPQIDQYLKDTVHDDLGLDYHVISVFGSQSTGKSTLLNNLFHTKFDVMNETQRQQTTKGIWLGYSPKIQSNQETIKENIFVMDVEGSDGRERGEDQDFERKAALFALSTSQVLIVNIWEHQVGLYQGANMGLLKTVFEVNLSLFGNSKHKVLLLFVIRDHIGVTPLANLSLTLTQDLTTMWESIAKPKTVAGDVALSDYFDLQFVTLSHKVLQPAEFLQDIKNLGDKFTKEDLLKVEYKQNLPIDGWSLYAENCWDQIQANKDLDLPTQQTLVARFRCDEIVKESLELFNEKFASSFGEVSWEDSKLSDAETLAETFVQLSTVALGAYDSQASHYNKSVYLSKREGLQKEINLKLNTVFETFCKAAKKVGLAQFRAIFKDKSNKSSFFDKSKSKDQIIVQFKDNMNRFSLIDQSAFNTDEHVKEFESEMAVELEKILSEEKLALRSKFVKKISPLIKNQSLELFATPDKELWDNVLANFETIVNSVLNKYKNSATDGDSYDFRFGLTAEKNKQLADDLKKSAWVSLDQFVHDYLNEDNVTGILKHRFEEAFQYDEHNVPRVWKTEAEIAANYKESSDYALSLLPLFAIAKTSNNLEIIPDYDLHQEDEDEDEDEDHVFAHILTGPQQSKVKSKFLKQIEINYRDATRSIVSNITKIPPFIYLIILILGWNEFMAVLRNPLYLILSILIGTGVFFIHTLNLWGPFNVALNVLIEQAKSYLASILVPEHPHSVSSSQRSTAGKVEEYEMDDLSEKKLD
ncbi:hypothetical protein WICPIJ_001065 [Wickerhamomyces pijperi]|uniref:GB1/RHD3-type G domain-containing protein n=1 Tax=Wickerhamomyces pijperi TaxID=599730 RepID=A0A9P8TR33_WICPI|nr:hypothetical protein WICPIJ_001065 [Wickerhamomyces pijperi]